MYFFNFMKFLVWSNLWSFQGPSIALFWLFPPIPQLLKFSSVTQSCPTLCDRMDHSTQASLTITNSWSLLRLMPIESVMPSNHLILCRPLLLLPSIILLSPSPPCLQSFLASGSFQMSQLFSSDGQNIGVSASTSVLPVNIQDWFPLGWTGWIFLPSEGLSRVFSNTTVQKYQFFDSQLYL